MPERPHLKMSRALEMVKPRKARRRVIGSIGGLLLIIVLGLWLIPWQQTVVGGGQVIVYSAMDRPQPVEAQIPGRVVDWRVQEGQTVRKGDVIAVLEDIDSKFLDSEQPRRLGEQRDFAIQTKEESAKRISELDRQRAELALSRENALSAARQAILQSEAREKGSRELVKQAEQTLKIAQKVAVMSAKERANQATDRIAQAEQAVQAAKQQAETMRLRLSRISELEAKGLRSKQDLEFAQNDHIKAVTEVTRSEKALEISRRDLTVGNLAQDQVSMETERARAVLDQAKASLDVAQRDVTNAKFNLSRLMNDTTAGLARVGADIQSAKESLAKNSGDVQKVENELGNLKQRTGQQKVTAPADGRVVRLLQVGKGSTVKAGDQLAMIVPDTQDRAVELFVSDNDVPLLQVGKQVRLQFAGWPAVQFSGMPSVAVGTFGGRVAVIDPVDDGYSRFRVIVKADRHTMPTGRKDPEWPDPKLLRPGAEAVGWVLLDTVPLGFELWRQFNGFPPRADHLRMKNPNAKSDEYGSESGLKKEKKEKDPYLGPVKLKSKS